MRIAIITLVGYYNYGQRLQNYALAKFIEEEGHQVETLLFYKPKKRNKHLRGLTLNNLSLRYIENPLELSEYDYIVVGSDQVFNPTLKPARLVNVVKNTRGSDNLIAYAASFGIDRLPEEVKSRYAEHLKRYKAISVREESGAGIVKELTGRKAAVLPDPVFLYRGWNDMAAYHDEGNYLFNYFVDGVEIGPGEHDVAEYLADKHGLRQVNAYKMPVPEFLGAIKYAKTVLTNSYHGVCFSIIFKVPFIYIENRKSMSSRIETLFNTFNDYSSSREIIAAGRHKAKTFLRGALIDT